MNLNQATALVLHVILVIVGFVFALFGAIELWLRHLLARGGIHGHIATAALIVAAIVFFIGAIRLLGGALQLLILAFLFLFALQVLFAIAPV
ncbi:hypothetical protein GCM10011611_28620 [Aliidongia dinghuensis]|uniref:Uncharacterized protein n=1 Tax=Aliidongia dinghuensis TaxID=1867774 RepID=A0A8J2YUN4_9PROT|nr:hypothetical protein [Aliidongia dinghuensis]GGF20836.1 hypothetical protein GCM10011611_28620 [Aliidongia dinghuensis]